MGSHALARLGVKAALFEPGGRLGWTFRDRLRQWREFDQAPPGEWKDAPWQGRRLRDLSRARAMAFLIGAWALGLSFVGYLIALLIYRLGVNGSQTLPLSFGTEFALKAWALSLVAPLVLGIGLPLFFTLRVSRARRARERAWAEWMARKRRHEAQEQGRVNRLMEWEAAPLAAGTQRIDVFGGTLWSWESFLTTFGASMLRESPPVTVVDLSEELVSDELFQLAREGGFVVDRQVLPADLASSDLLSGLSAGELVDVLVESFHGDVAGANRAERTMDARILTAICGALGTELSMARVGEALRALMGEPGEPRLLSSQEWDQVTTELFSSAYVEQANDRLRKLEAYVHPLAALGTRPQAHPERASLRCLAATNQGPNAFGDLLLDLIVQWTMRQTAHGKHHDASPLLIVAGADHLQRRHLERLSDLCERRHVRLVYLFRHLRDHSLQLLGGGGAVAFMRLGNYEEAERAVNFIGRDHGFTISSICKGLNEEKTSFTRSHTRRWGRAYQFSEQIGWARQSPERRVNQYRVDPRTLQDLPDYALLVVEPGRKGSTVRAIECNPDIVSLPSANLKALPEPDSES
jgi:hypothetical protein